MNLRRILIGLAAAVATIFVGSAAAQADPPDLDFLEVHPNPAHIECFETADVELTGVILDLGSGDYTVDVGVYRDGDSTLVEGVGDSGVELDTGGNFALDLVGMGVGEYYASVSLIYEGDTIETWEKGFSIESESSECPEIVALAFEPNPATDVCPATTADTTLTGQIENFNVDDHTVGVGIYRDGESQPVEGVGDSDVDVEGDGSFALDVNGLEAGEYRAEVTLAVDDDDHFGLWEAELDVEIGDCGALADVLVDPDPVVNECPAMTGDTTVSGQIAGYTADATYTVGVEVFSDGSSTPLGDFSDSDVDVEGDGSFSHDVTGIGAGEYTAVVTLEVVELNGAGVIDESVVGFLVEVSDCAVEPDPTVLTGEIVDITRDGCEVTLSTETSEAGDFRIEVWDDGEHIDTVEWTQDDAGAHDAVWMITEPAMEGAPGVGFALYAQDDDVVPLDGVDPYEYPAEVADECAGVTDTGAAPVAADGEALPATGAGDAAQTAALIIAGVMVSAGVALVAIRRVRVSSNG